MPHPCVVRRKKIGSIVVDRKIGMKGVFSGNPNGGGKCELWSGTNVGAGATRRIGSNRYLFMLYQLSLQGDDGATLGTWSWSLSCWYSCTIRSEDSLT